MTGGNPTKWQRWMDTLILGGISALVIWATIFLALKIDVSNPLADLLLILMLVSMGGSLLLLLISIVCDWICDWLRRTLG